MPGLPHPAGRGELGLHRGPQHRRGHGGGLSRGGETLLAPLAGRLAELVPVVPRVVLSDLGEESVALGAVRLAIQTVEERLFGIAAEAG